MTGPYHGKRLLDLALVAASAPVSLLIGALVALAVRVTSPGPVLFRQTRVGRHGRPFVLLKFRTMDDRTDNPLFPDPARITRVGRALRRTSLDELPQILNILRDEMSVVGPRPTLPYQLERYSSGQRERLSVRPGVTGLAQVRGRNRISWADRIVLDLEYIDKQSPWFDIWILILTVRTVVLSEDVEGHPIDDPIAMPSNPDREIQDQL
jgi:lipopolysaccharide/colanic/teichoic acid biosynthesis glycosyltransferase